MENVNLRNAWQGTLAIVLGIVIVFVSGCGSTATAIPPSATPVPPTATPVPPSATPVPPTATLVPATAIPATSQPTAKPTAAVTTAAPSGVSGHWEGAVTVAGQVIVTRADFATTGNALQGTVEFPQQTAQKIAIEKVSLADGKLHFEVLPQPGTAVFDGVVQGSDKIEGTFEQSGYKGTFSLARVQVKASEPLPYKEEEVKFQNGAVTLAGTLTLPDAKGPFPAVVLITGSGSQNRDEEIYGFKIFRVIADALTRKGIAVLRYDDRGIGGSSAGTAQDTSETYAGDMAAAVQFLKGRADIAAQQIGLLGHSEGGIIAAIVATRSTDVAFVILMSGPGTSGRQVLVDQGTLIAKAGGASAADVEKQAALQKKILDAAITGQGWDEVKTALRSEYKAAAATLTPEQLKLIGDVNTWIENNVQAQVQSVDNAWMKFFLTYDPAPTLQKVTVPVLALFGGLDLQVPADANRTAIMAALDKGGNKDHTARVFADANHLYQSAKTGSPSEYATLKPEFTAGFLDTISDWILAHVAAK